MSRNYQKIRLIANLFVILQLLSFTTVLCVETYLFYLYLTKTLAFSLLLLAHVVLVTVLYFILKILYRPIIDKRVNKISILLVVSMGPVGAAAAIVGIILYLTLKIFFSHSDKELLKYLLPEEKETDSEEIYNRLIFGLDSFDAEKLPTVFNDVLIYGSERQKRIVIERMLRYFRVEFSPVLLEALNDENGSIRVLAATAVTRIDKQYSEENLRLQRKVESKPNDFDAHLNLAKQSEEYSKLGFIDEQRRGKYRMIAVTHFEEAIKINPDDAPARVFLAEIYYLLEKNQEIIDYLEPVINSDSVMQDKAIKWYLSALFKMKKFDEIRELTRTKQIVLKEDSFEFDRLLYIIIMWKRGCDTENSLVGAL